MNETISAIAGVGTALRAALDVLRGIGDLRDNPAVNAKIKALSAEIVDAQSRMLTVLQNQHELADSKRAIEQELMEMKGWAAEKNRYELVKLGAILETYAYAVKEAERGSEPAHKICANCYNRGEKSILQSDSSTVGGTRLYSCPNCKTKVPYGR